MQIRKDESISVKREDAEDLILEVLKKIPDERKVEALRLLEGFALNESCTRKTG